jgi:hypothetical protein
MKEYTSWLMVLGIPKVKKQGRTNYTIFRGVRF